MTWFRKLIPNSILMVCVVIALGAEVPGQQANEAAPKASSANVPASTPTPMPTATTENAKDERRSPRVGVERINVAPASALPENTQAVTPTPMAAATPEKEQSERLPFLAGAEHDFRESAPSTGGLMLRTLGALILVVGLIVAAAWTLKRLGGPRFGAATENAPELTVLNSLSLGDKRSLSIVRFDGRTLLLGSTPQALTLLAEVDSDNNLPPARTVADLLNDDQPSHFAAELFSATRTLDQDRIRWKGDSA